MDPVDEVRKRAREGAMALARGYFAAQRRKPGTTGRSPDGLVEITVDGLGDLSNVRITGGGVPEEVAARIGRACLVAWRAARGTAARTQAEEIARTGQSPEIAELLSNEIDSRYGPPMPAAPQPGPRPAGPQPQPPPPAADPPRHRHQDEPTDDYGSRTFMKRVE